MGRSLPLTDTPRSPRVADRQVSKGCAVGFDSDGADQEAQHAADVILDVGAVARPANCEMAVGDVDDVAEVADTVRHQDRGADGGIVC